MSSSNFSPLFTQDPSFSHLNAGTRTRVPLEVLHYMESTRLEAERNPTKAMFVGYSELWAVQQRLAAWLGAAPEEIFLRANVTAAFNDFLFALPKLAAGEVVATGWEYGGTVGLLRHWAKQAGQEFRMAPLPLRTDWDSASLAEAVLAALTSRTRLLLLSHVATATGAILPVRELAEAARARGIITIVDGAHAIGALELNLQNLASADFYGGNFHKWFLGPEGTGFGWVHPRWRDRLEWKFGGWASERPPSFYQGFGGENFETARRFFPGTIDRVPFLALGKVLDFWERHGKSALRGRQAELRDLAAQEAEALGYKRRSPSAKELLGPLVSFERPEAWGGGESIALATKLYHEAKVQLALTEVGGQPLVRFSPGAYATEEEVRGAFRRLALFRA